MKDEAIQKKSFAFVVREAEQAESKPDFVHKMAIALKEATETEY